jgi:hypothetical protein
VPEPPVPAAVPSGETPESEIRKAPT